MYCKCTKCTYHEKIKMRKDKDGFWFAICPRCWAEYYYYK